jgi:hypothetical protein
MTSSDLASQQSFRAEQADFSESVRSCEPIGLRREEPLFDVSACSARKSHVSGPFFSLLCDLCALRALCVNVFSKVFPTTHHPSLTTHELHP